MKHTDDGIDFAELTPEHLAYIEAKQIRMAARAKGPLTASAERAQAWFTEKWNAWQARRILEWALAEETAKAQDILDYLDD